MSLTPNFTIAQTSNQSQLFLTDTSTGSDGAITDRQILIYRTDNSLLVPSIDWPIANTSITIATLTMDVAINAVVNWIDSGGGVLYTKAMIFAATQYAEQFYYGLTQQQSSQPNIVNDQNYFANKSKLRTLIDSATQAINVGNDIYSAQTSIALYQMMLQYPNIYF